MAEDAAVADAEAAFNEEEDPIDEEIMSMTTEEIRQRTRHLDEQVRICKATPSPPAPPPPPCIPPPPFTATIATNATANSAMQSRAMWSQQGRVSTSLIRSV